MQLNAKKADKTIQKELMFMA